MELIAAARRSPGSRASSEEGAISILTAALLAGLIAATSLAVDVGRVAYVSRDLQGATDRAALDAATALLQPPPTLEEACQQVEAEIAASLERNDASVGVAGGPHSWQFRIGRMDGNGELVPTGCLGMNLPPYPTALELTTQSRVDYIFTLSGGGSDIDRMATALVDITDLPPGTRIPIPVPGAGEPVAAISAATTTAVLEDGAVNDLIGALVGGGVEVGVVGWQGATTAMVQLGELLTELAIGTVEDVGTTQVTIENVLTAAATVLEATGDQVNVEVATKLLTVAAVASGLDLDLDGDEDSILLSEILSIDFANGAALDAGIDAFGLMMSSLQLANRDRAVDLSAAVPGVARAELEVVQPPRTAIGPAHHDGVGWVTYAETAQLELELDLPLTGTLDALTAQTASELGALMEALLCPPLVPCVATVTTTVLEDALRLTVVTGAARADLTGIDCAGERALTTETTSSAAQLSIPSTEILSVDASLLSFALAGGRISAGASVPIASDPAPVPSTFSGPFPADPQRLGGPAAGLQDALTGSNGVHLSSDIQVLGQPLPMADLTLTLRDGLSPVLAQVDQALEPMLAALGVQLGVTDVRGLDVLGCDGRWLLRHR